MGPRGKALPEKTKRLSRRAHRPGYAMLSLFQRKRVPPATSGPPTSAPRSDASTTAIPPASADNGVAALLDLLDAPAAPSTPEPPLAVASEPAFPAPVEHDAKALVHTVAGTAYLVSPGVFQRYTQEHLQVAALAQREKLGGWQWVQKQFERLRLHRKQIRSGGYPRSQSGSAAERVVSRPCAGDAALPPPAVVPTQRSGLNPPMRRRSASRPRRRCSARWPVRQDCHASWVREAMPCCRGD